MKMNPVMLNIPHIRQPQKSSQCGAACLAMIYQSHQHPIPIKDIWPKVKAFRANGNGENCRVNLMIRHAMEQGFIAIGVSVDDPIELIHTCLSNKIDVIALLSLGNGYAHFCVVTGFDDNCIFLNDPDQPVTSGRNCKIGNNAFIRRITPTEGSEIGKFITLILIAPKETPTISATVQCPATKHTFQTEVFSVIRLFHPMIVCVKDSVWCSEVVFNDSV